MRVLVIDDDFMLRDAAWRMLKRDPARDHEVVLAATGAEGLRLALASNFDVVVCDMQIGDMTGLEVWERLPDHLRRRFLLWTGAPELAYGTDVRVLSKPSGVLEFLDAVGEAYKG
jgi:CheY-like chemotaxis protein